MEHTYTRGESLLYVGKLALAFFGILALIYIMLILTPKIAAWIDKKRGKKPELQELDPETYQAPRGMFAPDLPKQKPKNQKGNEDTDHGKG